MKFDVLRDLTNKVFTSTVARTFVQNDPDDIIEAKLENDFGAVKVDTGNLFSGYIVKDATTGAFSTAITGTVAPDTIVLKFATPTNVVQLTKTSQLVFKCDAKLEAQIQFDANTVIPALKVAELKCELFEKVMQDRIVEAVKAWKAETTTFEDTTPAATFEVTLQ